MYARLAFPCHSIKTNKKRTRKNQSRLQTKYCVWLLGDVGMFISRVGIITLSFARGRAWGRFFFSTVSVGNILK
jgi:hypothetical protein